VRRRVSEAAYGDGGDLAASLLLEPSLLALVRRQVVLVACTNFERSQLLAPGTATLAQVLASSLGLAGWVRARMPDPASLDGGAVAQPGFDVARLGFGC